MFSLWLLFYYHYLLPVKYHVSSFRFSWFWFLNLFYLKLVLSFLCAGMIYGDSSPYFSSFICIQKLAIGLHKNLSAYFYRVLAHRTLQIAKFARLSKLIFICQLASFNSIAKNIHKEVDFSFCVVLELSVIILYCRTILA